MDLIRCVLFVPSHAASLLEMLPTANRVATDGKYTPIFFMPEHSQLNSFKEEHVNLLQQTKILVIGPGANSRTNLKPSKPYTAAHPPSYLKRYTLAILALLPRTWAAHILRELGTLRRLFKYLATYMGEVERAKALLDQESVVALILTGDRKVGLETALIKVANQRGIPSLIVPVSHSFPEAAARMRLKQPEFEQNYGMQSLTNRLAAIFFPYWIYEFEGKRMLFLPGVQSIPAWISGIMPKQPWTLGGGAATRMAVESPRIHRMFVQQGILAEKLVITGKPSVDQMFEVIQPQQQQIIKEELGIQKSKRILLCAVPQLAEHGIMSWSQHWEEIDFLLSAFAQIRNLSVILSLHPKSDPSGYRHLAAQYGAILAEKRIYELIPICDLFVATFSGTVMQAIGLGKPTVIVDFYGLNYTLYDDAPGVTVLRSRDQLQSTLTKLLSEPENYERSTGQQVSEWILLDGKCTERVVKELYELIEKPAGNQ